MAATADPVGRYSPQQTAFFDFMFSRFLASHMRGMRVARWGMPAVPDHAKVIVLANHPSWWDGIAFVLLARRLFPGRRMFAPMEAAALARYPFMGRIGVFGVEPGTRGAIGFLRTAEHVLAEPSRMLWMNAPGRFVDARTRPVPLAGGVVRLPEMAPDALVLPLALEYPFWNEQAPEMLAAFGAPIPATALLALDRPERAERLAAVLGEVADGLARDAMTRETGRFHLVQGGKAGMGGLYGSWQAFRARLRGEAFDPRHDGRREDSSAGDGAPRVEPR